MGIGRTEAKRGQPQAGARAADQSAEHRHRARDNLEGQAGGAGGGLAVGCRSSEQTRRGAARVQHQALKISPRLGASGWRAENVREIGKVQANLSNLNLALKHLQESMALFRTIKDQQGIGDTLIEVGNAYGE